MGVGVSCNICLDTVVDGHHIVTDELNIMGVLIAIIILADVVP